MKKLLLLVLVIVVSMACVAQAATKVAVPAKASGWVVGIENNGTAATATGAMPYIRFMADGAMPIDLGLSANYTNSDSYSADIMARVSMKLADVGALTTGLGLQLDVNQQKGWILADGTYLNTSLLMSAESTVGSGVVVYGNLTLLSVNNSNGTASILTGSAPCIYTGIRVNI